MEPEKHLRELPENIESKLREFERACNEDPSRENIQLYYTSSRNILSCGYDTRHHVASAYGLLKRLKGGNI